MWQQVAAIWWAQFRTSRNHLPRRSVASLLATALTVLWYSAAIALGILLAVTLPRVPLQQIAPNLGIGLLGVFVFWQVGPLFTMSTGWSLQLNKLLIYPIPRHTLFLIEIFLRFTTAPEMIPVLAGAAIGLSRHPELRGPWGLGILLYIPLNLFLALTIREVALHSFERNRFREIFTVFLIAIGLLPQFIIRTSLGTRIQPYFGVISNSEWTPWGETAHIAIGHATVLEWMALLGWTIVFFYTSRWLFARSLTIEETIRTATPEQSARSRTPWVQRIANLFRDPMAALIEKEMEALLRMPRFRVAFGMACVFSVIILIPLTYSVSGGRNRFMTENFLEMVALYGLLILSDVLLLNIFGADRVASQVYFFAPVDFRTVIQAKNIVAAIVVFFQVLVVMIVVLFMGRTPAIDKFANAIGAALVLGLFFMAVGNLSSVIAARPVDPAQAFRKQAGAKIQLWLLGCTIGMAVLVGAVHVAQWAVGAAWAGLLVLAVELVIAAIVYRIALDSATERGVREREALIDALTKNASPVSSGL